jgi:hypothetical protein
MPTDPADPESLVELVVVAFGAFERYYVCWRNQAGQYRQGRMVSLLFRLVLWGLTTSQTAMGSQMRYINGSSHMTVVLGTSGPFRSFSVMVTSSMPLIKRAGSKIRMKT